MRESYGDITKRIQEEFEIVSDINVKVRVCDLHTGKPIYRNFLDYLWGFDFERVDRFLTAARRAIKEASYDDSGCGGLTDPDDNADLHVESPRKDREEAESEPKTTPSV